MPQFNEDTLSNLRSHIKEYADNNLIHSKHGFYACPYCDSGHGKNRDSDGAFSIDRKTDRFKCFSCETTGDLFDLIGQVEQIEGFEEQVNRAISIYGNDGNASQPNEYSHPATKATEKRKGMTEEEKDRYREYIKQCHDDVSKTEYFHERGLSDEVIQTYGLGYDPSQNLITIPYGNGLYYITRKTDEKMYRKPASEIFGEEPLFNQKALYNADNVPVFICEGAIDALSVIACGGSAIATGSTSHSNLLQAIRKQKPNSALIICYDNDGAGQTASKRLSQELSEMNVRHVIADYPSDTACKDVNDLLTSDVKAHLTANAKQSYKGEKIGHAMTERFIQSNMEKALNDNSKEKSKEEALKEEISKANALEYIANNSFMDDLAKFRKSASKQTGFEKLDLQIGGLYSGLYVIGAVSSLGKTTFIHQMGDQMAERGEHILYFSMEQSRAEMVSKSLSRLTAELYGINTDISSLDIRKGKYDDEKAKRVQGAIAKYKQYAERVTIIQTDFTSDIATIEDIISTYLQAKGVTPVVIIDYLQIIDSDGNMNERQRIDNIVKRLKKIQLKYGLTMIVISSLNRSNYTTAIDFESFKESGLIEYSADVVWGLQLSAVNDLGDGDNVTEKRNRLQKAKAETPRKIQFVCLKNRYGQSNFTQAFDYYPHCDYFQEGKETKNTTSTESVSFEEFRKKRK